MKKLIISIFISLLIISCSKPKDTKNTEDAKTEKVEKVMPVKVEKVESGIISDYYQTVGISMPDKKIKLSAFNGGMVENLFFDEGDFVKKGQKLAEIDLKLYKVKLNKFLAEFKKVEIYYKKDKELYENKAISKTKYIASKSQYESLLQDIEQIKIYVDRAIIKAPESGYITTKNVEENENLSPGQIVCILDKMDILKVRYELPERDIRFYNNNKVYIKFDAYPNSNIQTKIDKISKEINYKNLTFGAETEIKNSDYKYRAGLMTRIKILKQQKNAINIQKDAVLDFEDGNKVFVLNKDTNRVALRTVKTGITEKNRIEIVSGLKADDIIVIKGQHNLFHNDLVEVIK